VQRKTDIGFIFAGSKTTLLNEMTLSPARPFYRMGYDMFVSVLYGLLPPCKRSRVKGTTGAIASLYSAFDWGATPDHDGAVARGGLVGQLRHFSARRLLYKPFGGSRPNCGQWGTQITAPKGTTE
jgi:hypothetical protein